MQFYRLADRLDGYLPVTLLKEYAYCPRQAYYKMVLHVEPPTNSMLLGREARPHASAEDVLRAAGVEYEVLHLQLCARHPGIRIEGCIDAVALLKGGGLAVVESKTGRPGRHHLLQAGAYALIAEHALREPATLIILSYPEGPRKYRFTRDLEREVIEAINRLRRLPHGPPPPAWPTRKCAACYYRKICW